MLAISPLVEVVSPSVKPETAADIKEVSAETYEYLATYFGKKLESVHKMMLCDAFADFAMRRLTAKGHSAEAVGAASFYGKDDRPLRGRNREYHEYCRLEEDGYQILIDGTWQQFLNSEPERLPVLPKTLVGEPEAVIQAARNYGVTNLVVHGVWLPDNVSRAARL